mmetsp:Transcript_10564/g.21258  ORF Transcript_10564/g.21258 Transcript_10564/m.21258 type:complete len:300 (-) Transcript_10564:525-1424(-)
MASESSMDDMTAFSNVGEKRGCMSSLYEMDVSLRKRRKNLSLKADMTCGSDPVHTEGTGVICGWICSLVTFYAAVSTAYMWAMRSTTRLEYPHSLSYHETSLTKVSLSMIPAPASKMEERASWTKSVDTTESSVYPMIPWRGPSEAAFMVALMSSYEVGVASRKVTSTTETSGVGTRNAIPVNFPLSSGMTFPTAFAAPVEDGMMFCPAPRPPLQSLLDGPSTVFCVAVVACTVVMRPSMIPYLSLITLVKGAKQLVVHDAFDTICKSFVYFCSFTPQTNMGASADGAEMTTFFAPPVI